MNSPSPMDYFVLRLKVADYVHGSRRTGHDKDTTDTIFATVRQIAESELTLLPTPEEMIASLPTPPPVLKLKIHQEFFDNLRINPGTWNAHPSKALNWTSPHSVPTAGQLQDLGATNVRT